MTTDEAWIGQAIELAVLNVAEGGGPFGALVVRDGEVVATGQNRMTLYTSCEPCPLCVSAALWARLDRVVYAADRDDAARGGFDDREFYELFARDRETWPTLIEEKRPDDAAAPFQAWLANANRTAY
jgi:guanine deaminase